MNTKTILALATLATMAVSARADTYAIDPSHTFVTFEIPHQATSTNRGRFDRSSGTVEFDRAGKAGKVELAVDTASISTGTPAFDKHLKGKDFFNTDEFPNAKFVADKFKFNGDKVTEVAGSLTLLGKTQPVALRANNFNCYDNPRLKREVCGGDFETTIARSQFGMNWGLNMGVPDQVRLVVQVEAIRQ